MVIKNYWAYKWKGLSREYERCRNASYNKIKQSLDILLKYIKVKINQKREKTQKQRDEQTVAFLLNATAPTFFNLT